MFCLEFEKIKEKLAKYCAYQDRCLWEIENKLKQYNLSREEKDEIIVFLVQNNFLNEERFVKNYIKSKFNQKHWGRIKIKYHLFQKNINSKLIDKELQLIDEENYLKTIREIIIKKYNSLLKEEDIIKKKKIFNYLIQKGYEGELILQIIKELEYE